MADRHDWETDSRAFDVCIKAWREAHGWSWQQVADELRISLATVQSYAKARYPKDTAAQRRLMTLIDRP